MTGRHRAADDTPTPGCIHPKTLLRVAAYTGWFALFTAWGFGW